MSLLRPSHKNLRLEEASYIYCKRHSLDMTFDQFIDDVFMQEDFPGGEEFDNICNDIRMRNQTHIPSSNSELTDEEWAEVVEKYSKEDFIPRKLNATEMREYLLANDWGQTYGDLWIRNEWDGNSMRGLSLEVAYQTATFISEKIYTYRK